MSYVLSMHLVDGNVCPFWIALVLLKTYVDCDHSHEVKEQYYKSACVRHVHLET